ncbi:MAG: AsmA-like C-terminal region-containing protein [Verrucomicrobiae bacterium]|nr:AsmA-like C-terminal region-containing protein [Verrucomicrobiae bacterium]
MKKRLWATFRILLAVTVVVVAGLLAYLYWAGLPEGLTARLQESLQKQGLQMGFGKLYFSPLQGVVGEDVTFFNPRSGQQLARVSRVQIGISVWELVRGKNPATFLQVTGADLRIPLMDADPEGMLSFKDTRARIRLLDGKNLLIEELTGLGAGVRFRIRANLILNPLPFKRRELTAEEKQFQLVFRSRLLGFLRQIEFDRVPELRAEVVADLGDPATWKGRASLQANDIKFRDLAIRSIDFGVGLDGDHLRLEKFHFDTPHGSVRAEGTYRISVQTGQVSVSSDFDFTRLPLDRTAGVGRVLGDFEFERNPGLEFQLRRNGPGLDQIELSGKIHVEKFSYRGVSFDLLDVPFGLHDGQFIIPDLTLAHGRETMSLSLLGGLSTGVFRSHGVLAINPARYGVLTPANYRKYMTMFTSVPVPVEIQFRAEGSFRDASALVVEGRCLAREVSLLEVPFKSLKTGFRIAEGKLSCPDGVIERKEGVGRADLVYAFQEQTLLIREAQSQLFPIDIAKVLGEKSVRAIEPYIFKVPPKAKIKGLIDYKTGAATDVMIHLNAGAMDYPLKKAVLNFDKVTTSLHIKGRTLAVRDFAGTLYEGQLTGSADFDFGEDGRTRYVLKTGVKNVNFQKLTLSLFKYGDSSGKLSGKGEYAGYVGDWETLEGEGEMNIVKGKILNIPFLGGISKLMDAIVPGFGYSVADKARSEFTIRRGVIHTKKTDLYGGGFAVICEGSYSIPRDRLDLDARVNMRGVFGALTFLVSELFKYHADGSFGNPNWQPKNF